VIANKGNLHEVFKAYSAEEVNKLIFRPSSEVLSCESDVEGTLKVTHDLLPQRVPLFKLLALVGEAVEDGIV
jgi:hypothetical protein